MDVDFDNWKKVLPGVSALGTTTTHTATSLIEP